MMKPTRRNTLLLLAATTGVTSERTPSVNALTRTRTSSSAFPTAGKHRKEVQKNKSIASGTPLRKIPPVASSSLLLLSHSIQEFLKYVRASNVWCWIVLMLAIISGITSTTIITIGQKEGSIAKMLTAMTMNMAK
jgi:hypothetical protein